MSMTEPDHTAHDPSAQDSSSRIQGTPAEEAVWALLEAPLEAAGYTIVRIRLSDGGGKQVLQVMAERQADGQLSLEDCQTISHTASALLDVHDPIAGAYVMEVSSPGIDRPLTRLQDFARYGGHEVKILLNQIYEGKKRLRGRVKETNTHQQAVWIAPIDPKEDNILVPLSVMASAKLVFTDALLAQETPPRNPQ